MSAKKKRWAGSWDGEWLAEGIVSSGRCPWRGGVWVEMWITVRRRPGRNLWAHCPGWRWGWRRGTSLAGGPEACVARREGTEVPEPFWARPVGGDVARALSLLQWEAKTGFKQGRDIIGLLFLSRCTFRVLKELFRCYSTRPPSDQLHQKGLVLMGAKSRGDGLRQPHGAEWGQTQMGTGPLPINRRAELLFMWCF